MLGQRLRRWPNIEPSLGFVFAELPPGRIVDELILENFLLSSIIKANDPYYAHIIRCNLAGG